MEALLSPFAYAFFIKGLGVATLAGGLCGLIGVYITLRGMSYIGHGLSHAIFGGFAASSIININYYLGAGVWGLASALAINKVTRSWRIGADAAIGVITTSSFALGVALLSHYGGKGPAFDAALFGSIIGVSAGDVWALASITTFTVAVIFLNYRALLFATFDPEVADVSGVRVARTDALLMLVLSLAILATLHGHRGHSGGGHVGDPRRRGQDAHPPLLPHALALHSHRRGMRLRRDEPQLPPRRAFRDDDRPHRRPDLHRRAVAHRRAATGPHGSS